MELAPSLRNPHFCHLRQTLCVTGVMCNHFFNGNSTIDKIRQLLIKPCRMCLQTLLSSFYTPYRSAGRLNSTGQRKQVMYPFYSFINLKKELLLSAVLFTLISSSHQKLFLCASRLPLGLLPAAHWNTKQKDDHSILIYPLCPFPAPSKKVCCTGFILVMFDCWTELFFV